MLKYVFKHILNKCRFNASAILQSKKIQQDMHSVTVKDFSSQN